jgi:hypothetical protein
MVRAISLEILYVGVRAQLSLLRNPDMLHGYGGLMG